MGEGPELARLEERCQNNAKLRKCVTFVGAVNYQQMKQEYEAADVLIMPSLRETTGTVLIEAMSKGVPVITIGKFGGAELLNHETGWLYTGESKQGFIENLKSAMIDCAKNPEEVLRRGQNARKAAEEHTWEKKIKAYQADYNNTVRRIN